MTQGPLYSDSLKKKNVFIYFWLCWAFIAVQTFL